MDSGEVVEPEDTGYEYPEDENGEQSSTEE